MQRRAFLRSIGAGVAMPVLSRCASARASSPTEVAPGAPPHLHTHADRHASDPRAAALEWFRAADFGLFMHYGLYSLLERGEWVQHNERIPLDEYDKLKERFTADAFDAGFITEMALAAGMRYVNLTSKHHDGFCLFRSAHTDFNSFESPAGRDLVGELAEQCQAKGLGLFLYYSYAADWRHPYFFPHEQGRVARPAYKSPEPRYLFRCDEDFDKYVRFAHGQLTELLTNYGPIAGIWFDPVMGYYARPDLFPIHETYALIRRLQPHCLISFKQGATGDEDFAAPERSNRTLVDKVTKRLGAEKAKPAAAVWERNRTKHNEICDTMQQRGGWGYSKDVPHNSADEVMTRLERARSKSCNLLMNTGPLPDGSIHADDVTAFRAVGRRLGRGPA